jgi:carboxymethylenebutenolidase
MQGTRQEFTTHDTEGTLATVVTDACVNHIPVLTGGAGKNEGLREFYSKPQPSRRGH